MEIREKLEQECADGGAERLYQKLREIDPLEAAKIHPNNHVRLVRALEIFYVTGKPKSELVSTGAYRKAKHTFQYHCLAPDREQLYRTINDRVDRMLADGLLDEVERLVGDGLADPVRQSNVIGYNELLDYLDGRWGLDEAVAMIKQNTRRYAKRQLTWFRGQPGVRFYSDSGQLFATLLEWGRGALDGAKKT
jgi:tRNA dimethylallyltransferase